MPFLVYNLGIPRFLRSFVGWARVGRTWRDVSCEVRATRHAVYGGGVQWPSTWPAWRPEHVASPGCSGTVLATAKNGVSFNVSPHVRNFVRACVGRESCRLDAAAPWPNFFGTFADLFLVAFFPQNRELKRTVLFKVSVC